MNNELISRLKKYWLYDKHRIKRPRSVVLKLTTKCNLSCKYCYVPDKSAVEMNVEMVEKLFDQLMSGNNSNVECVFHGGEPLIKFDLIKKIVNLLSKKEYANQIRYSIQTNATLMNHDVIEFILKHGISIGISIDGNQKTNDLNRKLPNGEGSYAKIIKAIHEMKSNNVCFGVLAVVTEETLASLPETVEEFIRLGIDRVDFKPFFKLNNADGDLMESSFADSMVNLLDYIIRNSLHEKIVVRDFRVFSARILERIEGVESKNIISMCDVLNCGAGLNHITVDTNGDVYACDRLYLQEDFLMGNLLQQPLNDILNSSVVECFKSRRMSDDSLCDVCDVNRFCFRGCPATNYLGNSSRDRDFNRSPVLYCSYYKRLIKRLLYLYETDSNIIYSLIGGIND